MKYVVVAVLLLAVCSVGVYANVNWYEISPCRAIDISLTDERVTYFLDSTDMATVSVHNCKYYQGYNTWVVNWHTRTQSQKVYVDILTGEIVGTGPDPEPCWHTITTFQGRHDKSTPRFSIKGDKWRIVWRTVGRDNESSISVVVYKVLMFDEWVDGFSGNNFPFSDTYYVYDGAGTYHLAITATALEEWELIVEDYY